MPSSIITALISLVSNGLSSVLDWKKQDIQLKLKQAEIDLSEKQLDVMKSIVQSQLQMFILDNSLKIDSDFRDFVTEYEGAAKDLPPSVQILRASIRPLITIWAVGLMSYLMFVDQDTLAKLATNLKNMPPDLWNIFMIVFGFWFGGRALQHVMDRYSDGRVQERQADAQGQVQVAAEQTKQEGIKAQAVVTQAAAQTPPAPEPLPRDHFTQKEKDDAFNNPFL